MKIKEKLRKSYAFRGDQIDLLIELFTELEKKIKKSEEK